MKWLITGLILSSLAIADDIKSLPNQAGNGNVDLAGTVILDAKEIEQVLGAPMDPGYIVVRIKVSSSDVGRRSASAPTTSRWFPARTASVATLWCPARSAGRRT